MSRLRRHRNRSGLGPSAEREQGVPAVVLVDGRRITISLAEKPPVGARLDVGYPVVVVESKDVAGGGVIVAATRADDLSVE